MLFTRPQSHTALEKIFLDQIEKDTPQKVKSKPLLDLNEKGKISFTLNREHLKAFNDMGQELGILDWFELYSKEAKISTAGIRGLQNPLYPWDTRYPLNLIGVMLATMGKVMVAKRKNGKKKISTCEVRYHSRQYVELIARLQAAYDITTYVTKDYQTIPIFLISFIIFMHDLYGGEYVTSSHAMCRKIATKDLNSQGSQYIPSESLEFVEEVKNILKEVEEKGQFTIDIAPENSPAIDRSFLESINNGIDLYVKYLKQGVATPTNINLIRDTKKKIVIECMGGSVYNTLKPILDQLQIVNSYHFLHKDEDPFNHGIGKVLDENGKFFDWGCDTTIMQADLETLKIRLPVVESVKYETLLKDYPLGTTVLMTDPDADRLVTAYIEDVRKLDKIKEKGLVYIHLDEGRILVMFTPNQSFLMTIDFQQKALLHAGLWEKYNWFMLKTTASQRSWDEWAMANKVPVINTPVGFKELADTMINIERKLAKKSGNDIFNKDVYGNNVNIGHAPRMLFAGEESGGEIFGPPELISSVGGRKAISMREKSAGEAIIITSAMAGWLEQQNMSPSDYLWEIYERNGIKNRFEIRIDQKFYNESEPDISKLLKEKEKGMQIKTLNNSFFLSLALSYRDGIISLEQVKQILAECFPSLNFTNLEDAKFVGDGTYFLFDKKSLEVRPSGTDAVNKAYCYGSDQWEAIKYAQAFAGYSGERTPLHEKLIPSDFYGRVEDYAFEIYTDYKENQ